MSVEDTLKERGNRYGDFTDHAKICQNIKRGMMCRSFDDLPDIHRQALEVIADKIARILSGDPNYADNWHDIQGYAKLVEDRLPKENNPTAVKKYQELANSWICNHGPQTVSYGNWNAAAANCEFCKRMKPHNMTLDEGAFGGDVGR
jgi:hypothetical protein